MVVERRYSGSEIRVASSCSVEVMGRNTSTRFREARIRLSTQIAGF